MTAVPPSRIPISITRDLLERGSRHRTHEHPVRMAIQRAMGSDYVLETNTTRTLARRGQDQTLVIPHPPTIVDLMERYAVGDMVTPLDLQVDVHLATGHDSEPPLWLTVSVMIAGVLLCLAIGGMLLYWNPFGWL